MGENKYLDTITETIEEVSYDERREERRMRRVRSRRRSIFMLVLFLLIITGLVASILYFMSDAKEPVKVSLPDINFNINIDFGLLGLNKNEIPEVNEELNNAIDEIISNEEDVVISDETPALEVIANEKAYDDAINSFVESMSLDDKVSGLFIVSPESITGVGTVVKAGEGTRAALEAYRVGGLTYGKKNIKSKDDFAVMLSNTNSYAVYPLFLSLNEDVDTTDNNYEDIGINLRRYNSDILTIDESYEEATEADLQAIADYYGNGGVFLIVSHISAPGIAGDDVVLSRNKQFLTEVLRMKLELHDLIVVTDVLNTQITTDYFDSVDASIQAIKAGADMLLLPEDFILAKKGVIDAVSRGVISEQRINDSLARIYRVKFKDLTTEEILAKIEVTEDGTKED